jgi:hypothetical protein
MNALNDTPGTPCIWEIDRAIDRVSIKIPSERAKCVGCFSSRDRHAPADADADADAVAAAAAADAGAHH